MDWVVPRADAGGPLDDRDGLRVRRAEHSEYREGLLAVLVALRPGLDGLRVRLNGVCEGLKLRAMGTGTGRETKSMARADALRGGPMDDGDSTLVRMTGTGGGKSTCEGGQEGKS